MYLRFHCSRRGRYEETPFHYPLGSVADVPDELAQTFLADKAAVKTAPKPAKPAPARPDAKPDAPAAAGDDRSIDELDLDDSTKKVLRDFGLVTVGEVRDHPDLQKIPGIGPASAKKIRQAADAI